MLAELVGTHRPRLVVCGGEAGTAMIGRSLVVAPGSLADGHYAIVELDQRDDWSEHQPTAEQENRFIEEHGMNAYARWHLGVDDEMGEDTKGHYKFPYGDFEKVHRCGVLAAESRAGQYGYTEIELATAHLHGALDALM